MIKFNILSRFSGSLMFTAEIDTTEDTPHSVKLGLAVKWALRSGANLSGANLSGANLSGANLSGANLSRANLSGANLYGANLSRADLYGANLSGANLSGANLYGANLSRADLYGADLYGANLKETKGSELAVKRTRILPEGSLIGWKTCQNGIIVKLRIPEEAKRSHAFGRKCRAEYADVIEVIGDEIAYSSHDGGKTAYVTGQRVIPDRFEDDWTQECAPGIHFFITREEAENY